MDLHDLYNDDVKYWIELWFAECTEVLNAILAWWHLVYHDGRVTFNHRMDYYWELNVIIKNRKFSYYLWQIDIETSEGGSLIKDRKYINMSDDVDINELRGW